jgi:glucose-6-phosphate 1-epimerase
MQTLDALNLAFAIQGHAVFEEREPGMTRLLLSSSHSEATVYLQGAHVTEWVPHGADPVLYLSPKAVFAPGKAIRGGVPLLFPWFGPRWNGVDFDATHGTRSPAHGFARTSVWSVESVRREEDGEMLAVFRLGPNDVSRALGFDHFLLRLECRVGRELHVALHVTNLGTAALEYEEGLHAYFAVADVHPARLEGLAGSTYIDKRDDSRRKVLRDEPFAFTRDVDHTHLHTDTALRLHDPAGHRVVDIVKTGSLSTVIWNPWTVLSPGFPDLPADGWERFICVETVNAEDNRLRLEAGETHTLGMTVQVAAT